MGAKVLPWIPKEKLDVRFSRSSGAGGQGVNRTESKVEMRFCIREADWLSAHVKDRLRALFPGFINSEDEFIVTSQETRSQKDNYQLCLEKLSEMIRKSLVREKKRIATSKTHGSEMRRLKTKSVHSKKKKSRGFRSDDE